MLVGAGMAAAVVGGLIGLLESYLAERVSEGIIFDLRAAFRQPGASIGRFYTSHRAGGVMSRMTNDIEGIDDVVAETLFGVARNAIVTVSTLGPMLGFDWRLTRLEFHQAA